MHTDKELYLIFRACPELIFLLAHLPAPRSCKLESITVKALQRTMDVLVIPDDPAEPLIVVEIQFHRSLDIYQRIIVEMALVQQQYPGRLVQGIIYFLDTHLDPATEPWKSSGLIRSVSIREEVENIERETPDHILVAALKPIFEPSQVKLEKEAASHYRRLEQSDLSAERREALCNAFTSLLSQRLDHYHLEQIAMMLELPGLQNTVSGKELMAMGEARQLQKNLLGIATKKFGTLPPHVTSCIQKLDFARGTELFDRLLDMNDFGDLERWLQERS